MKKKYTKIVYDVIHVMSPTKMKTLATYDSEDTAKMAACKIRESQKKVVMVCMNIVRSN